MFKSLVSAVKRVLPGHHTSDDKNKSPKTGAPLLLKPDDATHDGPSQASPPQHDVAASAMPAQTTPAPPADAEDVENTSFDDGVDNFLNSVIAGKTDKLRKEIAEQRLLDAAEEATQPKTSTAGGATLNASLGSGQPQSPHMLGGPATADGNGAAQGSSLFSYNNSALGNGSNAVDNNDTRSSQKPAYMSSAARSLQSYELIAYLGSGTFAEVTLARQRVTKELYAIKKISKQRVREEGCVERTFTERQLLASLRHPFLVQLYQAFQSRLYLYLVIDFAQGGDLYYFTEKTLWVKEMKRSLKKFKYPYYTNGTITSMNSTHRGHKSLGLQLDEAAAGALTDGEPSLHRTHRHTSWGLRDSGSGTRGGGGVVEANANGQTQDDMGVGAPRALQRDVNATHSTRPPKNLKKSKSTNDLSDTGGGTRSHRSPQHHSSSSHRHRHRQHLSRTLNGASDKDDDHQGPHSPSRRGENTSHGAGELLTPPSQVLKPQLRLTSGAGAAATAVAAAPAVYAAQDTDDTDAPPARRSVDLFSAEAVAELRRRVEESKQQQQQRALLGDHGNGTDTDGNTAEAAALASGLAGAGASASTLNAVRAGEYYTTDVVDEFDDSKDVPSDAGPYASPPPASSLLSAKLNLEDAATGGEVANKMEDAVKGPETAATVSMRRSGTASSQDLHMPSEEGFSSTTTTTHRHNAQRRRRDVERSRAEAIKKDSDDDDDDGEDNGGDDGGEEGHAGSASHRNDGGRVSHRASLTGDGLGASAARVPPSFRKLGTRPSSLCVTATTSASDVGEVGVAAAHPPTLASPGPSDKKLKRRTKSEGDLTKSAGTAKKPHASSRRDAAHSAKTPSASGRTRHGRREGGGSVVVVTDPTELLTSAATTSPRQRRSNSATITSQLRFDDTLGATAGGVGVGDSPPPRGEAAATPGAQSRSSRRAMRASRSGRRTPGSQRARSPGSASDSHRSAHVHGHRSGARSSLTTPSQSVHSLPTPRKVDINAPFHETRTSSSTVQTPPCAPDHTRLPLRLVAFYAIEIGLVLQYLHTSGFIYRDLKPENILMRGDGHLMLTDFGVAKYRKGAAIATNTGAAPAATAAAGGATTSGANPSTTTNTAADGGRATSFTGTAPYMSPEMVQGLPHDSRTDWWSFGCLLFEWCNGRKAYDEANQFALFRSIVEEDVKVKADDFKLTALELHSRVAQLHYRHQEYILTSLHMQFASLPQESQSNVVAALADGSFSHAVHMQEELAASNAHPPSIAETAMRVGGSSPGGPTAPVTAFATPVHENPFDSAPLDASLLGAEPNTAQKPQETPRTPSMASPKNPSLGRIPKELLHSLAGTPTNLSFQFAPDGSISATVGTMNPFAGITGEHLEMSTYELFMKWTIAQEQEALTLLEDLIRRLLNRNVQERLCGVDVLEHPFFTCAYITSQLYYHHYVREHYARSWDHDANETGNDENTEDGDGANNNARSLFGRNAAGEPDLSPDTFLNLQPPVRRPDAWVDLFEERRVPPVYVPRLRTQDDLRYFPSAVTAMGLSAAAEQQKRIKEAKGKKRELLRHAVEQAVQNSGAVMTEDENGVYLQLPTHESGHSPLVDAARTPEGSQPAVSPLLSNAAALDTPEDVIRRVSSSLTSATMQTSVHGSNSGGGGDQSSAVSMMSASGSAVAAAAAAAAASNADAFAAGSQVVTVPELAPHAVKPVAAPAAAAAPAVSSPPDTVDSLTDHLAGLIANIPGPDDSDGAAADHTSRVSSPEPPHRQTMSPLNLPADKKNRGAPIATNARLATSPLVLRDESSAGFSALRTSASAGDDPIELGRTQPMMMPPLLSSSASEAAASESDVGDEKGPLSSRAASQELQSGVVEGSKVRPRPVVVVPSLMTTGTTTTTATSSFALSAPIPVSSSNSTDEARVKDAAQTAEEKAGGDAGTSSGSQDKSTHHTPLLSLHNLDGTTSLADVSVDTTTSSTEVVSSRGGEDNVRSSGAASDQAAQPSTERGARHDSGSFAVPNTRAVGVDIGDWVSGNSSAIASTPRAQSPDDSVSGSTSGLATGSRLRTRKDDDDDDEEDDIMKRTAVLPAGFVKAALAVAAAQQQQQQQQQKFPSPPVSSDEGPHAFRRAPSPSEATPSTAGIQTPLTTTAPVGFAPPANLSQMAPSAVTVARPNLIQLLAGTPPASTGAHSGDELASFSAHSATIGEAANSNSNNPGPASAAGASGTSVTAGPAAVASPQAAAGASAASAPHVDDPALYLGVDTTGGYYETDALEEGDDSSAVELEMDAEAGQRSIVSADEGRLSAEAATTTTVPSAIDQRQHTAMYHTKQNSLVVPDLTTASPPPPVVVTTAAAPAPEPPVAEPAVNTPGTSTPVSSRVSSHDDGGHDAQQPDKASVTETFTALHGQGPLFDSQDENVSVASSARQETAGGRLLPDVLSEDAMGGGSSSGGDDLRMQSHTIVPSESGSNRTAKPSYAPSSISDPESIQDDDDEEGVPAQQRPATPPAAAPVNADELSAPIDPDEVSAPVDLAGYEEDQESGNSSVDDEDDVGDDLASGSNSASGSDADMEGSDSAYSDEDEEGSSSGSDSYSDESGSYSSASRGSLLEGDEEEEQAAAAAALRGTRTREGNEGGDDQTSTSTSTSSSSDDDDAGFGTDKNVSFSFGRPTSIASPSARGPQSLGVGSTSMVGYATPNMSLSGTTGMRYPNMMGLSTSYNPWNTNLRGSATGVPGDGDVPGSFLPTYSPTSRDGLGSFSSRGQLGSAAPGGSLAASSAGGGVAGSSLVNTSMPSTGYAVMSSNAMSGAQLQPGGVQPWWRTTHSPGTVQQAGGGPSGVGSSSFTGAPNSHSPSAGGMRPFPDLTLTELYGPVNTLSGVSYDVEDDVHSPVYTGRGPRHGVGTGAAGATGAVASHAVNSTGGGSGGHGDAGAHNVARRFTQPFAHTPSGAGTSPTAAAHIGGRYGRPGAGPTSPTPADSAARPSVFSTTDTRARPSAISAGAGQAPLPGAVDGTQSDPSSLSSTQTFLGFTYDDVPGVTSTNRGAGGHPHASQLRRSPAAGPAAAITRVPNTFTVSGHTRTSPTSGNASDDQDGGSAFVNNPDHFANFSFFSAPSGLLPHGYGNGNNNNSNDNY